MGVMGARRLGLGVLVCMCALGCALVAGAGSAWAAGGSFFFGPEGEEAGQLGAYGSPGLAVDHQSGGVYASDLLNNRVEKFDGSGGFLLAWGWGVANGANEFQTCTTSCQRASETGAGAGAITYPEGVAVDQANGDVYVVAYGSRSVEKFDSSGKFLLMFGGHVNKNGTNVCTASEEKECQGGTEGTGNGEFSGVFERAYIAVGPGGDVYVGDKARAEVFEPSGVWKENLSLSALSSEGHITALAVNSAGDVFVKVQGVPGVRGFEPGGIEMAVKFDEGSEAVESIALNEAGDLFVFEKEGGERQEANATYIPCEKCDFLEYDPSGLQLASFGRGTLAYTKAGMVIDDKLKELLVYGSDQGPKNLEYGHLGVWAFPLPSPGPLVEPGSEQATPELRGAATLEGLVNPEGNPTEVKFEYVSKEEFTAGGYAKAASTAFEPVGSGFEDQHVAAHLPQKTLIPGVAYRWRVVAHNAQGTSMGADQVLQETPPALVEGPWATSVTATSVTLSAQVNPLGAPTSYRLEYGSSEAYGHVFAGGAGEGMGYVPVSFHVQGLEAATTYHYRLVSESEVGKIEGPDHTFTTQTAGVPFVLPDSRAWELVSPAVKSGALIEDIETSQAARDGSGIVYTASEPIGEGAVGHVGKPIDAAGGATLLSRRGPAGWRTRDISPVQTLPAEGQSLTIFFESAESFQTFLPDLSQGVFEPRGGLTNTPQSPEASEPTVYIRNNVSETYEPLVTSANVPAGTKWGPPPGAQEEMRFVAATPDLQHVLISDWAALTPEALTRKNLSGGYYRNLYEWSAGRLQLVNIIPKESPPGEEPLPGASFGNGSEEGERYPNPWAMSSDGRWVVFRYGEVGLGTWYVRDMAEHKTVSFGRRGGSTRFEAMSRDGSRLFYLEPEISKGAQDTLAKEGELYVLDPATGASANLTANHLNGERSARVQSNVLGISDDGSYVYLVAKGVLASGAVYGQDNLYLLHYTGSEWQTAFIAGLSPSDEKSWRDTYSPSITDVEMQHVSSHVTANGRYLAFMSNRPLTGYDNRDAISGEPDEEVYLYDALANHLVCVSCNPTGARPLGVYDGITPPLMDQNGAWAFESGYFGEGSHGNWLAADVAPAWHTNWDRAFHEVEYLSDSGRLFFNSSDALVPQDTNGLADVYEYEPIRSAQAPASDTCTTGSATYSARSGGCVSLISSGQSSSESTYLDSSESGDDVFFITAAKLVGEDFDTVNDVYDAHACSVAVPCRSEPVSPPACTSGDSCKAAPTPQPEIFGPAPSATFKGTGNVIREAAKKRAVKHKHKSRRHVKHKRRRGRRARRSTTGRTSGRGN
jgi:hypothetical protein